MKLYYSPGACSLSPHIVLKEAGLPHELEKVDFSTGKTASGVDFRSINPEGYVPALCLDDGELLTEGPAIVQYLADRVPEKQLAPPCGTLARYRLMEWLNFIATELHKGFVPLFQPESDAAARAAALTHLRSRFASVVRRLRGPFAMGETFTVVDAYLFTVLGWTKHVGIDLAAWPELAAYVARIAERPAVQAALRAEGLSG